MRQIVVGEMLGEWAALRSGYRGTGLAAIRPAPETRGPGPRPLAVNADGRPLRSRNRPKGGGRRRLAAPGRPPPRLWTFAVFTRGEFVESDTPAGVRF
jgi:hypothetical protein